MTFQGAHPTRGDRTSIPKSSLADWVEEHTNDTKVRIVESDEDVLLTTWATSGRGQIDGRGISRDQIVRDYINAEKFAAICSARGSPPTPPSSLRRQVELGGLLRILGVQALRPQGLPRHERERKLWVDQKRRPDDTVPKYPADPVPGAGERGADPSLPRRRLTSTRRSGKPLSRPQPQGVNRREAPQGGVSQGVTAPAGPTIRARGTSPGSRAVKRGRHVQDGRRAQGDYEKEVG